LTICGWKAKGFDGGNDPTLAARSPKLPHAEFFIELNSKGLNRPEKLARLDPCPFQAEFGRVSWCPKGGPVSAPGREQMPSDETVLYIYPEGLRNLMLSGPEFWSRPVRIPFAFQPQIAIERAEVGAPLGHQIGREDPLCRSALPGGELNGQSRRPESRDVGRRNTMLYPRQFPRQIRPSEAASNRRRAR
jgi:hypothetical protein